MNHYSNPAQRQQDSTSSLFRSRLSSNHICAGRKTMVMWADPEARLEPEGCCRSVCPEYRRLSARDRGRYDRCLPYNEYENDDDDEMGESHLAPGGNGLQRGSLSPRRSKTRIDTIRWIGGSHFDAFRSSSLPSRDSSFVALCHGRMS